mmetsp:Transcript_1696/g.6402  ORF Transcript_1696/g.6402 Transcript_1696/m.6402 type:complete len:327 (+) Transcript_1696:5117-6097(+)
MSVLSTNQGRARTITAVFCSPTLTLPSNFTTLLTSALRNAGFASRMLTTICFLSNSSSNVPGRLALLPSRHSSSRTSHREFGSALVAAVRSQSGFIWYVQVVDTSLASPDCLPKPSLESTPFTEEVNVLHAARVVFLFTAFTFCESSNPNVRADFNTATIALAARACVVFLLPADCLPVSSSPTTTTEDSTIARNNGTTLAPSCFSNDGAAYTLDPTRCRPVDVSASTRGGIHQARHSLTHVTGNPQSTTTSFLPTRFDKVGGLIGEVSSVLSPSPFALPLELSTPDLSTRPCTPPSSAMKDKLSAPTRVPAAVQTESSRMARIVL